VFGMRFVKVDSALVFAFACLFVVVASVPVFEGNAVGRVVVSGVGSGIAGELFGSECLGLYERVG